MKILSLFRVASVGALAFPILVACSSTKSTATTKKAASGSAKAPTTKQPASSPKPTAASGGKRAGSNVSSNKEQSVATEQTCDAAEEGLAVCVDSYVILCAGQKVYALDCAVAFGDGVTCGALDDGTIDCVETVSE
jgi:hypothetical protein